MALPPELPPGGRERNAFPSPSTSFGRRQHHLGPHPTAAGAQPDGSYGVQQRAGNILEFSVEESRGCSRRRYVAVSAAKGLALDKARTLRWLLMLVARVLSVTQFGVAGTEADRPLAIMVWWLRVGRRLSRPAVVLTHLHACALVNYLDVGACTDFLV